MLAAPSARAGSYTATTSSGSAPIVTPAADGAGYPYDAAGEFAGAEASASARDRTDPSTYTIQVNPNASSITTTFTWTHGTNPDGTAQTDANDPLPSCAIVEQYSNSLWYVKNENGTGTGSGTNDCGLPGATITSSTYGGEQIDDPSAGRDATLYSVKYSPGASFPEICNPTASFTGTTGAEGDVEGYATVSGWGSAYPITITLGGTLTDSSGNPVLDSSGNQQVLTGQQITATLNGIPNNFTVTSYTWAPGGSTFKTYNETAPSNQLVPLGSAELTGPAVGNTTVAALNFYDSAAENLTVTCAVTVKAPDGTILNLTVSSPPIKVYKPTAVWGITTGDVHYNSHNDTADGKAYGLYPEFNSTAPGGVYWHDVVVTVPAPFSGGTCCFTQLVQPNHQYNGIGIGVNNNVNGLDNSFEYFNYT